MHNKKKTLAIILCFMSTNSVLSNIFNDYFIPSIDYFDFGLNLAKPYMWPFIPYYALGNGLKYIPQGHKTAAYLLGIAGFTTGVSILYCIASYGFKKYTPQKQVTINTQTKTIATTSAHTDKATQTDTKMFPDYSYVQSNP